MIDPKRKPVLPLPGLATVLVGALGLVIGWLVWQSAETRRQQEELIRRKDALRNPAATLRERIQSVEAWVQDGPAAVPQLLAELENPSPVVRVAAVTGLVRIRPPVDEALDAVVQSLGDSAPDVRLAALAGLWVLWQHQVLPIEPYLPQLTRLLDDPDERVRKEVLSNISSRWARPPVSRELIRLTRSERPETRAVALGLIREQETCDEAAIAAVRRLLEDSDSTVRSEAFRTLIACGRFTLEEVLAGLTSDDGYTRALARLALPSFGEDAAIAVDRLRVLLRSGQSGEVEGVLNALAAIGPAAEAAVLDVMQLLRVPGDERFDKHEYSQGILRGTALRCLARISTDVPLVVSTLRQELYSPNGLASRFAGETLRALSPEAARAEVAPLVEALASRDAAGKEPLLTALGGLGPEASAAVPALVELVRVEPGVDRWQSVSYYAVQTLGRMGAAAADAVPALAATLEANMNIDAAPGVEVLTEALFSIGIRSAAAERVLCRFIEQELPQLNHSARTDRSRPWRFGRAMLALGRVGANSEAAHQTVCRVLDSCEDPDFAKTLYGRGAHVIWALADVRVRPDETVTKLLRVAREDGDRAAATQGNQTRSSVLMIPSIYEVYDRLVAIRGLGLFPECADRSVPFLVETLLGDRRELQIAAALALGELGPAAHEAVPALRRVASAPGASVPWPLRSAARGHPSRSTSIWREPLPDPVWDFTLALPELSLADAARSSLQRIEGWEAAVMAPRPQ